MLAKQMARPNPSLHRKCYSGLRPPPHSGELKRWATAEYEASMRSAVHIGTTEHIERVHREVRAFIETQCPSPSASRKSLQPLRRSRSGGHRGCCVRSVRAASLGGRPSFGGRLTTELRHRCSRVALCHLCRPSAQAGRAACADLALRSPTAGSRRPAQPRIAPDVLQRASLASARG